jgi:hypothetical protein
MKSLFAHKLRFAALAAALSLTLVSWTFAQNLQQDSHQQATLVPGGSVEVENGRGDVWIEGSDKSEVVVDAHKYFDGNDEDRERWIRETTVRFEGDDHHRLIKVEFPENFFHGWGHWNGSHGVDLRIHVPRQVNAELKTDRGRLTVEEITGKVEIGSDRGDVEISRFDGELRLRADRGNVNLRDSKIQNGIHLVLDRGSADVGLHQLGGPADLEVSRGDISVTLPGNAAFTLDAERSRRSNFHSDFGVVARGGFDGSRIHGDVNGGGPTLRLRADRGSIWLRAGAR